MVGGRKGRHLMLKAGDFNGVSVKQGWKAITVIRVCLEVTNE